MLIVFGIMVMGCRFVFTETEVATTATAAATITSCYYGTDDKAGLEKVNDETNLITCVCGLRLENVLQTLHAGDVTTK